MEVARQYALMIYAESGYDEGARCWPRWSACSATSTRPKKRRAKAKIKATGIPFAVPAARLLTERLDAVLAVIFLIYNEGYGGRGAAPGVRYAAATRSSSTA